MTQVIKITHKIRRIELICIGHLKKYLSQIISVHHEREKFWEHFYIFSISKEE